MKHYIPKNSTKNLFYLFKFKIYLILSFILIYKNSHSFETHEIADGYYVHFGKQQDSNKENKGDIANLGFIIGNKSIAVIDTGGTPEIGEKTFKKYSNNIKSPNFACDNHTFSPRSFLWNRGFF